jgi:hypothetical protein
MHASAHAEREIRDVSERECGHGVGVGHLKVEKVGVLDVVEDEGWALIGFFGADFEVVELNAFCVAEVETVEWHAV